VDEFRTDPVEHVPADAEAFHHAGPEVLDQHVGGAHQVEQLRRASVGLQVEHDAALAAVEGHEGGVEPAGLPLAEGVSGGGLDLHHVRAHLGQQHGSARARDVGAEVEDTDVAEGQCPVPRRHGGHVTGTLLARTSFGKTYGPSPVRMLQYVST
jgi:hypothetical protein